jgi:4-amino-4-deoxy-L-arabinose transferase-like glycosyltransferase
VEKPEYAPLSRWVWILALCGTLLHFLFNRQYGFFRDELYYAACGEHLAWGYVDHSPLAPWVARFSRAALGDSLFALRFFPALASAAKIFLGGWIAREVGGRKFAQAFGAFTVLCAPIYLTFDNFFSMNSFEPVFWMACAAIVLRILNGGDERLWLLFGVVAGLGVLNKHSMLFFGSGLTAGLLLTRARWVFRSIWIWVGGGIVVLLFLPNLLWEVRNHYPTIQLLQTVIGTKYSTVTPLEFIAEQMLLTHPLAAPVWLLGLWFFLRDEAGKKYAFLSLAYFVVLAEMILLHGKIYYQAPAYVMLLAGGAVWLEKRALPRTGAWLKPVLVVPLVAGAAIAAPLAMPVLPVQQAIKYCAYWDVKAVRVENIPLGDLPQLFGDMFGWEEQAQAMSRGYNSLPEADRPKAALLAYNYGEAGAIDYFGKRYGLPHAISGHNQYGYWGPRGYSGEVVVAIGFTESRLQRSFSDVRPFETISPTHAMPEESNLTIYICRNPKRNLTTNWTEWRYLD